MLIENPTFVDIETNGFLDVLDTVHCLALAEGDAPVELLVGYQPIAQRVSTWSSRKAPREASQNASQTASRKVVLVAHNGIAFDIPALAKVFGLREADVVVIDTLVLSRLVFPDMSPDDDMLVLRGKLPARLMGSHSLEAWGYRLGCHKGDYAGGWEEYNPEMGVYCKQDVEVLRKLYKHILKQMPSLESVELEHAVQHIVQRQVRHGVCFNVERAIELNAELRGAIITVEKNLKATFGAWYRATRSDGAGAHIFVPSRDNAKLGYVAGAALCPVELVEFNPGSRAHITKVLLDAGWKPEKFTDAGNPKVDEEVLAGVDHPHVQKILAYLLLKKRLGQLSDGENGWLRLVRKGRIHGSVNTNGAVTGRMTHAAPNLAQVPSVKKGKNDAGEEVVLYGESGGWGYEMRDLFVAPRGKRLVGCDAAGLELRMLGHYMGRYDNGAYANVVVSGDIHTANQHAAGLPSRSNAKTFILRQRDDLLATARLKLRELSEHPTGLSEGNTERSAAVKCRRYPGPERVRKMCRVGELSDVREESCSLHPLADFPAVNVQRLSREGVHPSGWKRVAPPPRVKI